MSNTVSVINNGELKFLMSVAGQCVSIYMPTFRADKVVKENPSVFKKLLRDSEQQLISTGLRSNHARDFLKPAYDLVQNISMWRHQRDGLAVFISTDHFSHYSLPVDFEQLAIVSDRFHIKPLIRSFTGDGRYHVLALSQNDSRLFTGSRNSVANIELDSLPKNLSEALQDSVVPKQIHFHSGSTGRGGKRDSIIHGSSGEPDAKDAILRYFRLIDKALHDYLNEQSAPLVIAGVDYLFPIYKEANTYPNIVDEFISGNPEMLGAEELHEKAWSIVSPIFETAHNEFKDKFEELISSGQNNVSEELKEVLEASNHGRIDSFMVAAGTHIWGTYDADSNDLSIADDYATGTDDLLDLAVVNTIRNGGAVYVVEPAKMPEQLKFAALFRY